MLPSKGYRSRYKVISPSYTHTKAIKVFPDSGQKGGGGASRQTGRGESYASVHTLGGGVEKGQGWEGRCGLREGLKSPPHPESPSFPFCVRKAVKKPMAPWEE